MTRAPVGTLLAVLLVATAGCSTPLPADPGPEPGAGTETVTPVPVPGDEEATAAGDGLAPGLGPDGVTDAERLVDAHEAAVANASYTVRISSVRRASNGSTRVRYERVLRLAAPDRFHHVVRVETDDGDRRLERWRDGETAYEAVMEDGSVTYRSLEAPRPPTLVSRSALLRLFSGLPSEVTTTHTSEGTAVHRVAGGPRDVLPLSNLSYVALVTDRGLVRFYEVSYVAEGRDRREHVTVEVSVTGVGETTVAPPPWADDAR